MKTNWNWSYGQLKETIGCLQPKKPTTKWFKWFAKCKPSFKLTGIIKNSGIVVGIVGIVSQHIALLVFYFLFGLWHFAFLFALLRGLRIWLMGRFNLFSLVLGLLYSMLMSAKISLSFKTYLKFLRIPSMV